MTSKAELLKQRFRHRWPSGVRRELIVLNILNILLPRGFRAVFTGVGSGIARYVNENYDNPLNAFDITVFNEQYEPMAFIEVTGVDRSQDMQKKKGLCIGSWKVFKAEKFNVQDMVWYVHVVTDRVSLRFINYNMLKKHSTFTKLEGLPGTYYCCNQSRWGSIKDFLRWLSTRRVGRK